MSVYSLADLAREIAAREAPLLVLRVPALERIAWREGREAARELERRCLAAFRRTNGAALRASDLLGHDEESEIFVAALVSVPRKEATRVALPADCRATLVRLVSALERAVGVEIESGWTIARDANGHDPSLAAAVQAALQRGARERERYAFFSMIGHELRTPLTSIRGYLDTLLDEELDAATSRRFLEIARGEALRLGRLVDGMFQLSMLDLGEKDACAEEADVSRAIRVALDALRHAAQERGVSIGIRGDLAGSARGIGLDRLVQVASNLLDNAVKHGAQGGRVLVTSRCVGRFLELRVEDDGPGIAPERREAVFALGERGASGVAGSGIGLAVVRLIVERCGGEVSVGDSALGGASLEVRLPRAMSALQGVERT